MTPRAIITLLALSVALHAGPVYWAATCNIDFSLLGTYASVTGYWPDTKVSAPEDGSDPVMLANLGLVASFAPANLEVPGDKLLAMRESSDPNTDLYAGTEIVADSKPSLKAQPGAAPNLGMLGRATAMGFGDLTISRVSAVPGKLRQGRLETPDALMADSTDAK